MTSRSKKERNDAFDEGSEINIGELIDLFLPKWYIFAISAFLALVVGYIYIKTTPPIFTRTAEVVIKDDNSNLMPGELTILMSSSSTNISNEIRVLQSQTITQEVVERLNLNITYEVHNGWRYDPIYGTTQPIAVIFDSRMNHMRSSVTVATLPTGEFELSGFEWEDQDGEHKSKERVRGDINKGIETPIGVLVIRPTAVYNYISPQSVGTIRATYRGVYGVVREYINSLHIALSDRSSTSVILTLENTSIERADDYLNTLIATYNETWVKDKNQATISTDRFIEERLALIGASLVEVDEDISSIKSDNLMPDVEAVTYIYLQESSRLDIEMMEINTELTMCRYILDCISADTNLEQLLPASTGLSEEGVALQIQTYNDTMLQRNRVLVNSSKTNPLVVTFNEELSAMRKAIMVTMENQLYVLNARLKATSQRIGQATQNIEDSPKQALELLSVTRQQLVLESIYVYLLQERERNQLSQTFIAYNTRVISQPNGYPDPSSPIKIIVMAIALILGLAIPAAGILLRENMKVKIESRVDVEKITAVPFVGSIAYFKSNKENVGSIVVAENNNDIMSESFRLLRTNLRYMLTEGRKVILVTSTHTGEGKSYVSTNLGISLSLLGKRVVVVGLDIRKHGLNDAMGTSHRQEGITSYISGHTDDLLSLVQPTGITPELSVLYVGTIPPNPTELLLRDRVKDAIDILKENFDYVILDTAPVGMVIDTLQFSKYADISLYVCRAGVTHKRDFELINEMAEHHRLPNICTTVVGVKKSKSKGYGYGYGYGYGDSDSKKRG